MVVVVVMMMMVVVMVVMMMHHRGIGRDRRGRHAHRDHGRGQNFLDHVQDFPVGFEPHTEASIHVC
jgi:hypothetical protein